jgi:hypothetical protein
MTDADENGDAEADAGAGEDVSAEELETRLDEAEESLAAAETEADLDEVESQLDGIEADLEAADLPEADDEDEEDPEEALSDRLSTLQDDLEEQRGPYAEDVVEATESAQSTISETRWTEQGIEEVQTVVDTFLSDAGAALDETFTVASTAESESLAEDLDQVVAAVESADLDADEDSETIEALVDATDALQEGLDEAEEWDDLETNEQLMAEGYYDVLGHYKDYPVEWSALKVHEQQGNIEMVLLALDSLGSQFMERHCLEAITRMGHPGAFDAMHERAQKRDKPAITALGKMGSGAEEAVETLLEYVDTDSDPQLQKVTFQALGEIGSHEATQALANKLEMENDHVRPYAARSLGLLGDTRAVEPLSDTLENDENSSVRTASAWALRQLGTKQALEAVAEYEDARSYTLQSEAEKARSALDEERDEAAVEA